METSFLFVFVVIPKNPIVHEGFINNFLSIPYTKAKIPGQSKYQDFVLGLKKIVFFHDDSFKGLRFAAGKYGTLARVL